MASRFVVVIWARYHPPSQMPTPHLPCNRRPRYAARGRAALCPPLGRCRTAPGTQSVSRTLRANWLSFSLAAPDLAEITSERDGNRPLGGRTDNSSHIHQRHPHTLMSRLRPRCELTGLASVVFTGAEVCAAAVAANETFRRLVSVRA